MRRLWRSIVSKAGLLSRHEKRPYGRDKDRDILYLYRLFNLCENSRKITRKCAGNVRRKLLSRRDRMKIFNVNWETDTAGPSPYGNKRIELFLKGCKKAEDGNPCPGCFNKELWDSSAGIEHTPEQIVKTLKKFSPSRFITIGGGEPTDQMSDLIALLRRLKFEGYHTLVYTYQPVETRLFIEKDHDFQQLAYHADMIISGPYKKCFHQHDPECGDGFYSSIGSSNQVVWDMSKCIDTFTLKHAEYYACSVLDGLALREDHELIFITKPEKSQQEVYMNEQCN